MCCTWSFLGLNLQKVAGTAKFQWWTLFSRAKSAVYTGWPNICLSVRGSPTQLLWNQMGGVIAVTAFSQSCLSFFASILACGVLKDCFIWIALGLVSLFLLLAKKAKVYFGCSHWFCSMCNISWQQVCIFSTSARPRGVVFLTLAFDLTGKTNCTNIYTCQTVNQLPNNTFQNYTQNPTRERLWRRAIIHHFIMSMAVHLAPVILNAPN